MDIESDNADVWIDTTAAEEKAKYKASKDIPLRIKMEIREEPYRVRLVSKHLRFRKYYHPFAVLGKYPISPAYYEKEKDLDIAWSQGNWYPPKKGVVVVIDREHPGMLRLIEAGEQVFGAFEKYASMTKKSPCGPSAPDWLISVSEEKGQTKYTTMADPEGPKPFTDDEKALILRSKLTQEFLEERFHYKRETPESIKELWLQLPEDKRYYKGKEGDKDKKTAPKAASTTPDQAARQPATQAAPSAPAPQAATAPSAAPVAQSATQPKVAAKDDNFLKEAAATVEDQPEANDSADDPEAASLF
jgi:hypothetical protein